MNIILCHPGDAAALWLHGVLQILGTGRVDLITIEQLVYSRRIVHRLDASGDTGAIHLAEGRVLRPEAITGLVNRVQYLPTAHFATASAADRAYATEELSAFVLAWLDGVAGRVINPPLPSALGGGAFAPMTTAYAAAMAGLPLAAWRGSSMESGEADVTRLPATHAAIVLDGQLFGSPIPHEIQDGCRRLSMLLGTPLLQVQLHRSRDDCWRFIGASGAVDFPLGGRPLAMAIAHALSASPGTE
jgi:hypothetical protein